MRFSLLAKRYLKRQALVPVGAISRYRPRPSKSLLGFWRGRAWRMAASIRRIDSGLVCRSRSEG